MQTCLVVVLVLSKKPKSRRQKLNFNWRHSQSKVATLGFSTYDRESGRPVAVRSA